MRKSGSNWKKEQQDDERHDLTSAPNAQEPRGWPATGTVATITRGRGDGFVRETGGELLYFNRRDVVDGSFNDLNISDSVAFEVIEDHVSGHRAARLAKQK